MKPGRSHWKILNYCWTFRPTIQCNKEGTIYHHFSWEAIGYVWMAFNKFLRAQRIWDPEEPGYKYFTELGGKKICFLFWEKSMTENERGKERQGQGRHESSVFQPLSPM